MKIIKVNETIDIITNDYTDFNKLTPLEQVDYMETANRLYYLERMKRKQQRRKTRLF